MRKTISNRQNRALLSASFLSALALMAIALHICDSNHYVASKQTNTTNQTVKQEADSLTATQKIDRTTAALFKVHNKKFNNKNNKFLTARD